MATIENVPVVELEYYVQDNPGYACPEGIEKQLKQRHQHLLKSFCSGGRQREQEMELIRTGVDLVERHLG